MLIDTAYKSQLIMLVKLTKTQWALAFWFSLLYNQFMAYVRIIILFLLKTSATGAIIEEKATPEHRRIWMYMTASYNKTKYYPLMTFLWGFGIAVLVLTVWMAANGGCFLYYADYNYQQIPFYTMLHDTILNGAAQWSYTTDLGANTIGSYSFYLLGSPFFWITLLFPSEAVPYLLAPLLMIKSGLAAMTAYIFLQRYVSDKKYAMVGGVLYAFSGIAVYNIIFNHFHEPLIIFPLMMAAIDSFVIDKKRGIFALTVFASVLMNYYFFAGQTVFIFLYWCLKMFLKDFRMTIKEFIVLVFEIVAGLLCAGVLLVPSVIAVLQNQRLGIMLSGSDILLYEGIERYLHILISLFFPPDMPNYLSFINDENGNWSSISAYIPMFGMVGVIALYSLRKHRWLKIILPAMLIFSLIPVLNSSFQLFNGTYYARWFYMPVLLMSLATAVSLDDKKTNNKPALIICTSVTASAALLTTLLPESLTGNERYPLRFWLWCGIAAAGLGCTAYILSKRKKSGISFKRLAAVLSIMVVLYGNILIGAGVLDSSYKKGYIIDSVIGSKQEVREKLPDIESVRSDFYYTMENTSMYWQIPSIQAFHSIVPCSVTEFYNSLGYDRLVRSEPGINLYGIRSLLSVKYLFAYSNNASKFESSFGQTRMPGWKRLCSAGSFDVYENENYIPYGFTYDEYITQEQFMDADESKRHLLLLKAIVLSDEQAERFGGILTHHKDTNSFVYDDECFSADCNARRSKYCDDIRFENNTVTAHFTSGNKEELVFFSIPYDNGWTAEINGQETVIEKVNEGFMAVKVPADTRSEIVFRYSTPGLKEGIVCSLAGLLMMAVYYIIIKRMNGNAS